MWTGPNVVGFTREGSVKRTRFEQGRVVSDQFELVSAGEALLLAEVVEDGGVDSGSF